MNYIVQYCLREEAKSIMSGFMPFLDPCGIGILGGLPKLTQYN